LLHVSGRKGCFSKALFFVGELGVNDYNFIWMSGKTADEVRTYVPRVVETIKMAVEVCPIQCVPFFHNNVKFSCIFSVLIKFISIDS
jgi:hypothetical protein